MDAIKNRYEFVVFFDVENGNPNGEISHEKGIVINRHKNVLSFSLGVIF